MNIGYITVEFRQDTIWGDRKPEMEGSALYARTLRAKLEKEYPGAHVTVMLGSDDRVMATFRDDVATSAEALSRIYREEAEARDAIQHIIERVWKRWLEEV